MTNLIERFRKGFELWGETALLERKRRRTLLELERLEDRTLLAVTINPGANLNISKLNDSQAEGTIAIDPTNGQNVFTAAVNTYGSSSGTYSPTLGFQPGLYAAYSSKGGAAGSWVGSGANGYIAIGVSGGDSLPAAAADPRATFDQFGNLFLTYLADPLLQLGTVTSNTLNSITDNSRTPTPWTTNEWAGMSVTVTTGVNSQTRTIFSNTGNTITITGQWSQAIDNTSTYKVTANGQSVIVALSSNGGSSFQYVTRLDTGPAADQPDIATGPGPNPGQGSVWVAWRGSGGNVTAAGALVTGKLLANVGAFTPEIVNGSTRQSSHASVAIGPTGQVAVSFYNVGDGTNPIALYTNTDADGLGPNGFNANAVPATQTTLEETAGGAPKIPAQPNRGILSDATLTWDRSGKVKAGVNGRLYMVYTWSAGGINQPDTDIWSVYSDDAGATWSPPTVVNSGNANSQFLPAAAVDQTTGYLAVTWYDTQNDPANVKAQIYGTVSTDGGQTFLPEVKIGTGQSDATKANSWQIGTSTGVNTETTLNDTTQTWIPNDYWKKFWVSITAGTGKGEYLQITGNTATQLTVANGWKSVPGWVVPDNTSQYQITPDNGSGGPSGNLYAFDYGDYTDLAFQNKVFFPVWADNSNSTGDNANGAFHSFDLYTAAVTVNDGAAPAPGGTVRLASVSQPVSSSTLSQPKASPVDPKGLPPAVFATGLDFQPPIISGLSQGIFASGGTLPQTVDGLLANERFDPTLVQFLAMKKHGNPFEAFDLT